MDFACLQLTLAANEWEHFFKGEAELLSVYLKKNASNYIYLL